MASTTSRRPCCRFSICGCAHAIRRAGTFGGGVLFFPAAFASDCCIDLVIAYASPGRAARLDQCRCALALSATLAWITYLILRFNRPLIAGVCVCRHEVWDSIGATIETRTLSEVSVGDLGSISATCLLLIVSCLAECVVRIFKLACDCPIAASCVFAALRFWFR